MGAVQHLRIRCVFYHSNGQAPSHGIVYLACSTGHPIRNRKAGTGWISYLRMGALYSKFSIITTHEFLIFLIVSACLLYWDCVSGVQYGTPNKKQESWSGMNFLSENGRVLL